jgi:hypothetical protein
MKRKYPTTPRKQINKMIIQELRKAIEDGRLDEGIWDSLKNAAAKLGSMEKGGKVVGRGKRDKAAELQAAKSLKNIENKAAEASKALITRMNGEFKEQGYPNQKDKFQFLEQTYELEAFYDSIVKASQGGKMPAVVANEIISDLRIIVKRFLDYELADIYKHFNEEKDPYVYKEQDQDSAEEGPISRGKDSSTMAGLKSNVLPMVLAALGGTSLLADIFVKSEVFKNLATKSVTSRNPVTTLKNTVMKLGPADGEGMTQMVGRLSGDSLNPKSTLADFFTAAKKIGITPGNLESVGTTLGADPGAYAGAAKQAGTATLEQVFGQDPQFFLDKGTSATTNIVKTVTKTVTKTAVKSTVAGKIGATVGPFLAPLGIGLVASAAAVKALRVKGQKSSRAQVLNDLLQKLDDVADKTTQDQKQISGPTDSPKRISQQDQLPAVVDTATDLATITDPDVPEEEKVEIVNDLSTQSQAVSAALARAGVPENKIEQIIQRLKDRNVAAAAEAVEEVEPQLDPAIDALLDAEAERRPVPTSRDMEQLRTEFQDAGFNRARSAIMARFFNGKTLKSADPQAFFEAKGRSGRKQHAAVGDRIIGLVKGLTYRTERYLIMRFIVKRAYDFRNLQASSKEEKINVVRNVKSILRHMSKDAGIATMLKTILQANPDKLNSRQIEALKDAIRAQQGAATASRSPEKISSPELTAVAEARKKSSQDRFKKLAKGLTKKRIQ